MADDDLSKLYAEIRISDEELMLSREKLLSTLAQQSTTTPNGFRVWMTSQTNVLSLAAVAMMALIFMSSLFFLNRTTSLDARSLIEIQQFVSGHGDHHQLFLQAAEMRTSESPEERLNGLLIVTMLATGRNNILASAQGLVEDPRTEFRIYYLEYLLEHGDEEYYNLSYLEDLMDREQDPECLYLLGELLRLALWRQKDTRNYI